VPLPVKRITIPMSWLATLMLPSQVPSRDGVPSPEGSDPSPTGVAAGGVGAGGCVGFAAGAGAVQAAPDNRRPVRQARHQKRTLRFVNMLFVSPCLSERSAQAFGRYAKDVQAMFRAFFEGWSPRPGRDRLAPTARISIWRTLIRAAAPGVSEPGRSLRFPDVSSFQTCERS